MNNIQSLTTEQLPIKFTKEQSDFIQNASDCHYNVGGSNFYFIPYWFEKIQEDVFMQHHLKKLPAVLTNRIKSFEEAAASTIDQRIAIICEYNADKIYELNKIVEEKILSFIKQYEQIKTK